jgi:hypothetical protein
MGEEKLKEQYEAEARVIYDRRHGFNEDVGPSEGGRIGVAFGSEVFWTGSYSFPGDDMVSYGAKVGFATELARRWNAGRLALQSGEKQ